MSYQINPTAEAVTPNLPIAQSKQMLTQTVKTIIGIARTSGIDLKNTLYETTEAINLLEELPTNSIREMSSVSLINQAMNHLRTALADLQQHTIQESELEQTTQSIAKTLAILYPLSKFGESKVPPNPIQPRESVPQHIKDRRTATRMAIEAEVGFQSDTNFFMGFSEDVSTGGLFISTYDIRPIGNVLNLNFTLPDGHLISVDGIVRWVREYNETTPDTPPGMGIQFEDLSPEDKEAIEMFIEQRPAIFYDDE